MTIPTHLPYRLAEEQRRIAGLIDAGAQELALKVVRTREEGLSYDLPPDIADRLRPFYARLRATLEVEPMIIQSALGLVDEIAEHLEALDSDFP